MHGRFRVACDFPVCQARKKIREVEKIEVHPPVHSQHMFCNTFSQEAYSMTGKLEPGQLAKVHRKAELEQAGLVTCVPWEGI